MHIADWLSRAYLETGNKTAAPAYQIFKMEEEDKLFEEIEQINPVEYIRLSDATGQQIKKVTQGDTQMQSLMRMVLSGWPDNSSGGHQRVLWVQRGNYSTQWYIV